MKTITIILLIFISSVPAKAQMLSASDSSYTVVDSIVHAQVKTDITIHKNYLLDLEAVSGEISQYRNVQSVYNWLIARDTYLTQKKKQSEKKENDKRK